MTPLQALERLYGFYDLPYRNEIAYMLEQENLGEYKEIIEKSLKALEIIKEKEVNVRLLIDLTLKEYNYVISDQLTQEEFNLLMEVLK